jgi:hypothetical protein
LCFSCSEVKVPLPRRKSGTTNAAVHYLASKATVLARGPLFLIIDNMNTFELSFNEWDRRSCLTIDSQE